MNSLYSPVNGRMIELENVPDEIFAKKMMGDGVAFEFKGETIYAPCDARVGMIANTKHAIGLIVNGSIEVIIHIGLDTVNLNGKGFEVLVSEGDKVKKGQQLIKLDRKLLDEKEVNLITPMVLTNYSTFEVSFTEKVSIENMIIKLE